MAIVVGHSIKVKKMTIGVAGVVGHDVLVLNALTNVQMLKMIRNS